MRTVIPIALFVLFAPAALAADPAALVERWAAAVGGQERIKSTRFTSPASAETTARLAHSTNGSPRVVDFDYPVTLRQPSDCRSCEKGISIPFALVGQQPYIDGSIRVGDQTIRANFILDVGAADTMTFATPFVTAHNLAELAGERGKAPRRLAGSEKEFFGATTIRGLIDEIHFGSVVFRHVPVNLRRRDTRGTSRPQHAQIVEFDFRAILRR
jgi:hypothetical protein